MEIRDSRLLKLRWFNSRAPTACNDRVSCTFIKMDKMDNGQNGHKLHRQRLYRLPRSTLATYPLNCRNCNVSRIRDIN